LYNRIPFQKPHQVKKNNKAQYLCTSNNMISNSRRNSGSATSTSGIRMPLNGFACKRPIMDTKSTDRCINKIHYNTVTHIQKVERAHRTLRAVKSPTEFGSPPVKVLYDRSLHGCQWFMFYRQM
jgi:hypothetical protein